MGELQVEVEPGDVGLDEARLGRLTAYLDRLVETGRIPGWLAVVSRHGQVAYLSKGGYRHVEEGLPVETDTIFRIYSMTKPVTSVAAMMLLEEGAYELTTPVGELIPAFRDMRVYAGGSDLRPVTVPASEPDADLAPADPHGRPDLRLPPRPPRRRLLRQAGYEWSFPPDVDLEAAVDTLRALPAALPARRRVELLPRQRRARPGRRGGLGLPLDRFFAERIFGPLGMTDTAFGLAGPDIPDAARLARLYAATPTGRLQPLDALGEQFTAPAKVFSGGRRAGVDGGRLPPLHPDAARRRRARRRPAPRAPDAGRDDPQLAARAAPTSRRSGAAVRRDPLRGVGFGLGLRRGARPGRARAPCRSVGEYSWGGAASTRVLGRPGRGHQHACS